MAAESENSSVDERSAEEWTAAPPASNWRPPRAGPLLAGVVVLAGCWLLADALGSLDSLSIAGFGAAGLAGVIWLTTRQRFSPAWTVVGVVGAPVAGGLLTTGIAYVAVAQLAGFARQGSVFVGLGVVLAAFGAAAMPGDAVDRESVTVAARETLVGVVALLLIAGGLVGNTVRREGERTPLETLPLPESLPSLFPETTLVPPLGMVLLIGSLSLLAFRAALTALPVAELLDDRAADPDAARQWFDRLLGGLNDAQIGVVVGIVLLAARLLFGEALADLWGRLPLRVADLLGAVGTAPVLRWLATRLLLVSVVVVGAVKLLRGLHGASASRQLGRAAPFVGAGLAIGAGWLAHEQILSVLLTRLEEALPPSVAAVVLEEAGYVIDYYSGEVVAVGLVAVGGATAVLALGLLRLGMLLRVVPSRHSGHAFAGAGLLVTGGFAAAIGAPLAQALGTIVGAVVVWDLGGFGVGLGRDVGRRAPSLVVQFVRAFTAALLGVVTAAMGLAAASTTASVSLATETAAVLALFAAVGVTVLASLALAR
jgi:hypothetical protein